MESDCSRMSSVCHTREYRMGFITVTLDNVLCCHFGHLAPMNDAQITVNCGHDPRIKPHQSQVSKYLEWSLGV